jgi:hypothetical protein
VIPLSVRDEERKRGLTSTSEASDKSAG